MPFPSPPKPSHSMTNRCLQNGGTAFHQVLASLGGPSTKHQNIIFRSQYHVFQEAPSKCSGRTVCRPPQVSAPQIQRWKFPPIILMQANRWASNGVVCKCAFLWPRISGTIVEKNNTANSLKYRQPVLGTLKNILAHMSVDNITHYHQISNKKYRCVKNLSDSILHTTFAHMMLCFVKINSWHVHILHETSTKIIPSRSLVLHLWW